MNRILLLIFLVLLVKASICQSNATYTPSGVVTGTNPNTAYELKKDEEERFKRVFGDRQMPKKYEVPVVKNSYESTVLKEEPSKPESYNSSDYAQSNISSKPNEQSVPVNENTSHVRETHNIPYDKSMDEFINGALGYDPNLTLEQNRELYKESGYSISYKVKDNTIFAICGIIILLGLIFIIYKTNQANYQEKYKTEN